MELEIKKSILERIKAHDSIVIVRHVKPDGDCMGSSIGLREILRASFPDKKVYSFGGSKADYLEFIGTEDEEEDEEICRNSLLIVVDTATFDRIDSNHAGVAQEIIKIDHHIPVDDYGTINYVREDLPATCAIILDLYDTFSDELVLTDAAAKALFTGLVTDTGRFRYNNIDGPFMRLVALALERDINIEEIYSHLYLKDKNILKLQGHVLNHFKATENGVAHFKITKRLCRRHRVSVSDASALVNLLDSIKDHLIWLFFIESEDGTYRVRIRSRYVAINGLAEKYGGGGHKQAAGALVRSKKEMKTLLKDADNLLKEYKQNNPGVF